VASRRVAEGDQPGLAAAEIAALPPEVDAVVLHLSAACGLPRRPIPAAPDQPGGVAAATIGTRQIRFGDTVHDAPLYRLDRLPAGATVTGPAIIENDHTSILLPPDVPFTVDASGGGIAELPA
jgi:N-methylhydantoinase A/oxoprolinase/acetone carboxylase beta subunit